MRSCQQVVGSPRATLTIAINIMQQVWCAHVLNRNIYVSINAYVDANTTYTTYAVGRLLQKRPDGDALLWVALQPQAEQPDLE